MFNEHISTNTLTCNENGMINFEELANSALNNCSPSGGPGDEFEWLESAPITVLKNLIQERGEEPVQCVPEDTGEDFTIWVHPAIAMAFSLQGNPHFLLILSDQLAGAQLKAQ